MVIQASYPVALIAFLVASVGLTWLVVLLLIRNHKVYRFMISLANDVRRLSETDADGDWQKRWDTLEQVSYNEMVFRFWIPLKPEYWWDDTSFLR